MEVLNMTKRERAYRATKGKRLPIRALCARYSVVDRTIDRWLDRGLLPAPLIINGRRYWDETELEEFERARMGQPLSTSATRGRFRSTRDVEQDADTAV
jgi:MerR HTH family regulatory protein